MATPTLDWLDFDYSEDPQGHGSFDAMASVTAAQLPALQRELERVLAWAHREFGGVRAPLDEGGDWDFELQGLQEVPAPLDLRWTSAGTKGPAGSSCGGACRAPRASR